jgi:hypothetical protein
MQRNLRLITPVITTKPASSELINSAPAEKATQVKHSSYFRFHPQALPANPPFQALLVGVT